MAPQEQITASSVRPLAVGIKSARRKDDQHFLLRRSILAELANDVESIDSGGMRFTTGIETPCL